MKLRNMVVVKVYRMSSRIIITVVGQEISWSKQCHGAE